MERKPTDNRTILVTRPGSDSVMLVVAMMLDPDALDVRRALDAIVPEMGKGKVRAGLVVVGDSTLVIRLAGDHYEVNEVDTASLLALADVDDPFTKSTIVSSMQRWIEVMSTGWRDRMVGPLRDLLVPHVAAGLAGDVTIHEGVWGLEAHRIASEQ